MDGRKRRVENRRAVVGDGEDNTVIDQIMLRFRPIAPRPETAESSGYVLPENVVKRKRKYVRVKKKKKKVDKSGECHLLNLNRTVAMIENSNGNEFVVTDPLRKPSNWISFDPSGNDRKGSVNNNLLISEPVEKLLSDLHGVDLEPAVDRRTVVESWITVETVTGTCEDRRLIGDTDNEIRKNLETDSCPGFISNGYGEVLWVNPAYRRMLDLDPDGGALASEVVVWLVVKVEKSTVVNYLPAFSCRVKIEYQSSEKKMKMTVPCDVCKMDSGGFAWLLDVRVALSLGPLNN